MHLNDMYQIGLFERGVAAVGSGQRAWLDSEFAAWRKHCVQGELSTRRWHVE